MQKVLAIAVLTLKAALRYRLVMALAALLTLGVVVLPLVIEHDGTARGFTQIILTYTLSLITALLAFTTLWLSCGILAREIEEAQMQVVVVKPIARWQIWIGKWIGIMMLNAMLLTLSGAAVYGLLVWRAGKLPEKERVRLREQVMIARAAASEPMPDFQREAIEILRERFPEGPPQGVNPNELQRMVTEQVKAAYEHVRPDHIRQWTIELGHPANLRDVPMQIRAKINTGDYSEQMQPGFWEIGRPEDVRALISEDALNNAPNLYLPGRFYRTNFLFAPTAFTEFTIPPNLFDSAGRVHIRFYNFTSRPLLFPLEDGMRVFYRQGGFGLNFVRAMTIIACWLALLAALGLAASSLLSFPVASFCAIGVLLITFSTRTLKQIIEEGGIVEVNPNTGFADTPNLVNQVAVPMARGLLWLLNLARGFSPIDYLSGGLAITWPMVAAAVLQIVIILGGVLAVIGILIFNRRELATAQGAH